LLYRTCSILNLTYGLVFKIPFKIAFESAESILGV
jgi:hypothetical protein